MQPVKADYFQTYVSQHVPPPFELMQRALENKQKHYDVLAKNMEDQEAFLNKLTAYTDADQGEVAEIRQGLSDQLHQLMESGDLTQNEEQIRKFGRALGQEFTGGRLGELVRGKQVEDAYNKMKSSKDYAKNASHTDKQFFHNLDQRNRKTGGGENELVQIAGRSMLSESEHRERMAKTKASISDRNYEYDQGRLMQAMPPRVKDYYLNNAMVSFGTGGKGTSWKRAFSAFYTDLTNDSDYIEEVRREIANQTWATLTPEQQADPNVDFMDVYESVSNDDINQVVAEEATNYAARHAGYDENFIVKNTPNFAAAEKDALDPLVTVTVPTEGELHGASDIETNADMKGAIKTAENNFQTEAKKVFAGVEGLNVGSFDYATVSKKLKDPAFKKKLLEQKPDSLDQLEALALQYENLQAREQEASEYAQKHSNIKMPEEAMKTLGITANQAADIADPSLSGETAMINMRDEVIDKMTAQLGGYEPDAYVIGAYGWGQKLRWIRDKAEAGDTKAKKLIEAWDELDKIDTEKYNDYKEQYYENTSKGFVKTQGATSDFPVYSIDETTGAWGVDKNLTKSLTAKAAKVTANTQELVPYVGRVKTDDGWEEVNIGQYIKDLDLDGEAKIGTPKLSKSFGQDGRRYVSLVIEDKEVHIPITSAQFPEVMREITKPYNMNGVQVSPYKVDQYLYNAFDTGRSQITLPDGGGVINIPRNPVSQGQQGSYTFFNDSNFTIKKGNTTLSGNKAYNYLLLLQANGSL